MGVKLNKAQQTAVNHMQGEMLVVAGAGTGKTSVIVERIVNLINSGVDKKTILALTFTEKAAQEMLNRTSERLNDSYGIELNLFTFNAFGNLILEEFAIEIGLSNNQKLVGEQGKVVFMREHLDLLELDYFAPVSNPDGQLSTIADYFSKLKQQLITPEKYIVYAEKLPSKDEEEILEKKRHVELARAYENYIKLMRSKNIIDYDDQIYLVVELLYKRQNIRKKLQERYHHIMVDEFQDTNPMQSALIDLLYSNNATKPDKNIYIEHIKLRESEAVAEQNRESQDSKLQMSAKSDVPTAMPLNSLTDSRSLMVVGDDDQAIYGWRGATLANILEFTKKYPQTSQVTLIENYRNTQTILDSAYKLIQQNNPNRLEHLNNLNKKLNSNNGIGMQPYLMEFTQRELEISWVAEDIKNRIAKDQYPGSIAVLGRSRQIVADVHNMLDIYEVEHVAAGLGEDLYQQLIVLTMVDSLSAVWNPSNNLALYHTLMSKLFNCDLEIISRSSHEARTKKQTLFSILNNTNDENILDALKKIQSWHNSINTTTVRQLAFKILKESGMMETLKNEAEINLIAAREIQILNQWFQSLKDFEKITNTASIISYLENFDVLRAEGESLRDDTLDISSELPSVMTMHKSKGLEWQTVYLVGCNSGSFPFLSGGSGLEVPEVLKLSSKADERLNEERRLMYVCVTRAKSELIISYSTSSATGKTTKKPSRFIEELGIKTPNIVLIKDNVTLESDNTQEKFSINIPTSMREGENIVLSASQAEDYLDCGLNFYYKHVLGVPEEPSFQTEVGSLYHDIIESINKAKMLGSELPTLNNLKLQIESEWPETGYLSQDQRKRDIKQSLESFDSLYERLESEPVPIAVEEKFRVHLPESKLILKGRIDVVMPVNDGVEMHDYKTSASVNTPEKAKKKTGDSKQLTMYALAWQLQKGDTPKQVCLDYVRTGQIGVVKKMPRSIDNMAENLSKAAEDILAGKFPKGSNHEYCIHPI